MTSQGVRLTFVVLVTSGLLGCSSPDSGSSTPAAASAPVAMGTFAIGESSQQFRVIRCDLSGTSPDSLLLRGSGTMPDMQDEDGWEATATSIGGGRWTSQDNRVLDSPITQIEGNDLVVTATFTALSGESSQAGTLRVTCPAPPSNGGDR